jgi:methylamine--corrinoid protein Co-methyltransferase
VLRVAAKLNRTDVNDIVKNLLNLYEENLSSASEGKRYQDCFDVTSGLPKSEYLEFYNEIKKEISKMGVLFDS